MQCTADSALRRTLDYLADAQTPKGAWTPLWFGNQYYENDENPVYGTGRVLIGLTGRPSRMMDCGIQWLIAAQKSPGSRSDG